MEMWLPVVGYEGYYEVSNEGSVRSVDRDIIKNDGVVMHRSAGEKAQRMNRDGYMVVKLSKDGVDKILFVHRVVYEAFVGNIPEGLEINHKDFDRSNNTPENLEAISHEDNIKYTCFACRNYTAKNDTSGKNNPNYGNKKLSKKYAAHPELAKEKQGRPGSQNGRCKKIIAYFPDGVTKKYDCIKDCANEIIDMGLSNGNTQTVYQYIWRSMKDGSLYKGVRFLRA